MQPGAEPEGPFPAPREAFYELAEQEAAATAASEDDLADSRRNLEARLGHEDEEDVDGAPHGMEAEEEDCWGDFPPWVPPEHQPPAGSDAGEANVKEEEEEESGEEDPTGPGTVVKEEDDHPWSGVGPGSSDEPPARSPREDNSRGGTEPGDYSLSRVHGLGENQEPPLSFDEYGNHFGRNRLGRGSSPPARCPPGS